MKRFLIVMVLVAIIGAGTAFADNGLGIGVLWGGSVENGLHNHAALSLKLPSMPIFWGIRLGIGDALYIGVQGDMYILQGNLMPTLSWFLGLGLYGNFYIGDAIGIGFGGRVPIGLRWRPIGLLEIFGNVTPQIGGYLGLGEHGSFMFPSGGYFGFELGVRLWL